MMSTRPVMRATAANSLRASRQSSIARAGRTRFQSTTSSASSNPSATHIGYSVAGGAAGALLLMGGWMYLTPSGRASRAINKTYYEASKKYKETAQTLQAKTPSTDEAIDTLRDYAYSYVAFIPGGRGLVDTVFKDLDQIRQGHGKEVDDLVRETYSDLANISKQGLSMQSFTQAADVLNSFSRRISKLAAGSIMDIMDNHPQVKNTLGGPLNQLKQMGENYGPEAKQQLDQTWQQIQEIMQEGFSANTLRKAQRLVEEKSELLRNIGQQAWDKGYNSVKPYLEREPKVKELIEKNMDSLKSGNATELFQKAKDAISSGNTSNFEKYVNETVDKAKNSASGMSLGSFGDFDQYAKMIPGGSDMMQKLSQFKNVAQNNREEGEKLLKETMEEIQKVISKQSDKAKSLLDKSG